jgi:hypothetical protein
MLTFSGLTFDLAAAINIAIGGLVAVIGGLVAARMQANATRRAADLTASVQVTLQREADLREWRKNQVKPALDHAGQIVNGYGRVLRLAQAGKAAEAIVRFRHLAEEAEEFDLASTYTASGPQFLPAFTAFLEYERQAQAAAEQCVAMEFEEHAGQCLARELPAKIFPLAPTLANLHRFAARYIYGEEGAAEALSGGAAALRSTSGGQTDSGTAS